MKEQVISLNILILKMMNIQQIEILIINSNNNNNNNVYENIIFPEPDHLEIILPNDNNIIEENNNK